jgi:peptidoglycan hydrolase CwlO-like protein
MSLSQVIGPILLVVMIVLQLIQLLEKRAENQADRDKVAIDQSATLLEVGRRDRERLSSLETEVGKLHHEVDLLRKEVDQLRDERAALIQERDELRDKNANQKEIITRQRGEIDTLTKLIARWSIKENEPTHEASDIDPGLPVGA